MKLKTIIVFCFLYLLHCEQGLSAVFTLTNSGSWNNTSIWSPNGVPSHGDVVIIDNQSYTVTLPSGLFVSIEALSFTAGTISGNGSLTILDVFNWAGGNLTGTGEIIANQGILSNLPIPSRTISGWTLTFSNCSISGSFTMQGGSITTTNLFTLGASLSNLSGSFGIVNVINNCWINGLSVGQNMHFNTAGLVDILGTLECSSQLTSDHSGAFYIGQGAEFIISNGTQVFNNAAVFGEGYLNVMSSGTLTTIGLQNDLNKININGGTLNGNRSKINTELIWQDGTITSGVDVFGQALIYGPNTKTLSEKSLNLFGGGTWTMGDIHLVDNAKIINEISSEWTINTNSVLKIINPNTVEVEIENRGIMVKLGSGVLSILENITFINLGEIKGIGTIKFDDQFDQLGTIEVGPSIGVLAMSGEDVYLDSNSEIKIDLINNSGPGIGHDQVIFVGNQHLNGHLNISYDNDIPNGSYTILRCTGSSNCFTGVFNQTTIPDCFELIYLGNEVIINVNQQAPIISGCPQNINRNINPMTCSAVVSWTLPTVSAACGLLSFETNQINGGTYLPGTHAVTYTATDILGNTSVCNFNIVVNGTPSATASGNNNLCIGQTLNLLGETNFGTSFHWSGPNGFTANTKTANIPNLTRQNAGSYIFTTSTCGFTSPPSNFTLILNGLEVWTGNNSGTGTLRGAINCAEDSDTITIDPQLSIINMTSPLSIQKNITIQDLSGHPCEVFFNMGLSGFNAATFGLRINDEVGLKNLIISHKDNTITKPLLLNIGNIGLDQVTFKGNTAPYIIHQSGAVCNITSEVNIIIED